MTTSVFSRFRSSRKNRKSVPQVSKTPRRPEQTVNVDTSYSHKEPNRSIADPPFVHPPYISDAYLPYTHQTVPYGSEPAPGTAVLRALPSCRTTGVIASVLYRFCLTERVFSHHNRMSRHIFPYPAPVFILWKAILVKAGSRCDLPVCLIALKMVLRFSCAFLRDGRACLYTDTRRRKAQCDPAAWTRGDRSAGGDRVCECGGVLPAIPFMDHGGHAPGLIASAFRALPWPAPRYPATGCAAAFYGGKAFPCSFRRQGNRSSLPQSVPGADKM